MNTEKETYFVNHFIVKNRRKRLLYELGSDRKDALSRFNHGSKIYLILSKVVEEGEKITKQDIKKVISKSEDKTCYLISWNDDEDGKEFDMDKALDLFKNAGMACILLCGEYAAVKEEQCFGAPNILILYAGK